MELPPPPHPADGLGVSAGNSPTALPPPPPLTPPVGAASPAWTPPVGDADRPTRPHRSRLSAAWRWIMGLGWCVIMAGMGALAQSAFLVDADPWWLAVKPLPFALPVAMLLATVTDTRWVLPLSALAAFVLVALAVVDALGDNPVVGVLEGACALSGVLLTLGAFLGRERPAPPDVPRSAE